MENFGNNTPGVILAVDVGTTNLTCHVFDKTGISKYGAVRKVCMFPGLFQWVKGIAVC